MHELERASSRKTATAPLIIIGTQYCRRTRKIVDWLQREGIPFDLIDLESEQGRSLAREYGLRASPGILRGDQIINPFELLRQCRANAEAARRLLTG